MNIDNFKNYIHNMINFEIKIIKKETKNLICPLKPCPGPHSYLYQDVTQVGQIDFLFF